MKWYAKQLALIIALVSSLAVLQSCTGAGSKLEETNPSEMSQVED